MLHDRAISFLLSHFGYRSLDEIRKAIAPTEKLSVVKFTLGELEKDGEVEVHPDKQKRLYRLSDSVRSPQLVARPRRSEGRTIDSHKWTGDRLILVDSYAIRELRRLADQLKVLVDKMRFPNNSDSVDIHGLVSALVAVAYMAEPDVPVLDRIFKNPKIKTYAQIANFVAAMRTVTGI